MSKTFVLIHGTWHGGWAWNAVARELSRSGHYPHAPTMAGHGPNTHRAGITHKDCVDSVSAYIRHHELKDLILLGHSFGGSVVQKVAEQLSDCIRSVVFLDALILADGQCVFDNLPPEYVAAFNDLASSSANNTMLIPWEIWRDNFMQDAPESVARSIWEQLTPEPNQVNLDKIDLKRFYSLWRSACWRLNITTKRSPIPSSGDLHGRTSQLYYESWAIPWQMLPRKYVTEHMKRST